MVAVVNRRVVPQKLNTELTYDPAISLLCMYPKLEAGFEEIAWAPVDIIYNPNVKATQLLN